jgi:hypothetical protein
MNKLIKFAINRMLKRKYFQKYMKEKEEEERRLRKFRNRDV